MYSLFFWGGAPGARPPSIYHNLGSMFVFYWPPHPSWLSLNFLLHPWTFSNPSLVQCLYSIDPPPSWPSLNFLLHPWIFSNPSIYHNLGSMFVTINSLPSWPSEFFTPSMNLSNPSIYHNLGSMFVFHGIHLPHLDPLWNFVTPSMNLFQPFHLP